MFPSLDTTGYVLFDPFNQTTMLPSFVTQIQSPSSHHHLPSPSLPFYTELFDDSHLISQFLLQPQEAAPNVVESPRKVCKKLDQKKKENCVDGTTSEKSPRRRTGGKGDRHSKICTAQGPRDRRMRLSLQTARKFFDLQDMLGFDKASKTIEWLISKSQTSIKQVKESVAASGGGGGGDCQHLQVNKKAKNETLKVSRRKNKIIESSSKKKESREKARKRARERTVNKMKMRLSELIDTSKTVSDPHQETRKMKITSSAQVLQGENQEQEWSTTNVNMVKYQIDSVSIIEKFLGLTNDSSSSSILRDSEESYTTLSSIRGTNLTTGMETPREHNNTPSIASVDEERNPISSFSLYDYICY